ncbi:MAG: iron hydrogenase small subunit [Sedimentisphaerales bacterium]|nr:iron hydrogenase small subunit [Sedimentisphaerales bacterium]
MTMVNIKIDGKELSVADGTTIMQAADGIGINIPRLCYHPDLSLEGACRVCIVEVVGMPFYMASCSVKVWEGMEVRTCSPEIRQARRDIIELILDNHPKDCQTCQRDGQCELQRLAYSHGVRERLFEGKRKNFPIDSSSKSVVRNANKCILCGRCFRVCEEVQSVSNLCQQGRGFDTVVAPAHMANMDESVCIQCGQCINVCPTAAFLEQDHTERVWQAIADPNKLVVFQVAPSIRAAIGEGFGLEPGTPVVGQMVAAIRRLGADVVFDTDFSADLTIMEEANEFLERVTKGTGPLPLLTSCSPGWVSFVEKFYPEFISNCSSCKSPMSMMSTLVKTWYAEKQGIDPKKIYNVGIMPCTAKKYEMARPELTDKDGDPYTDAVLTTRELIWMIKCYGIDMLALPEEEFDSPMGLATGAGDIFGTTGGVMEAALRTAAFKLTGKPLEQLEFKEVRAVEGLREVTLNIADTEIRLAVANGLDNARTILESIKNGEKDYHLIEMMACPGGCINGGGQPYPPTGQYVLNKEIRAKRAEALYKLDKGRKQRCSHENPDIINLYETYLGEPGSHKAHELLHTSYKPRYPRGV